MGDIDGLTPRMIEILLTYAETGTVAEAANRLSISESTLKNQLSTVYHKLGVTSGIQALYQLAKLEDKSIIDSWKKHASPKHN